ncbi:hypothetical protein BN1723_003777 [Verticillium longisporum]|uniref:NADP-dependent oxidoreductase domain-containing protein n=1 Tax=Verticillium longisporum TaxID=100787 RepID=A0A0G4M9T2_VERLO|nr:hypothetical protein BN1723_003777 [Verticillium longisporum]
MTALPPLSSVIPPLILGTATFNIQYHPNPDFNNLSLPVLRAAFAANITAIDTSPYYGPSELLVGAALSALAPPRDSLFLITKAGRVGPSAFDYSPAHIRHSVHRSLARLHTPYLDLVHCHDVEFVSPAEVLAAVRELRALRSQGLLRYVGISGYPPAVLAELAEMILRETGEPGAPAHAVLAAVRELRALRSQGLLRYVGISGYPPVVLADLAEMILRETGEPLDAVQSYSHLCIQNDTLASDTSLLDRFDAAGVSVVTNASMLSMGLLTTRGADAGPQATWHPAPRPLRTACRDIGPLAVAEGSSLEKVALHWAMSTWARMGARFGTTAGGGNTRRIGVSVMGVTNAREFEETNRVWQDVLLAIDVAERPTTAVRTAEEEAAVALDERFRKLVEESMWPALGGWRNYSWESPQADFVNTRSEFGVLPTDLDSAPGAACDDESNMLVEAQRDVVSTESVAPVLTGAASCQAFAILRDIGPLAVAEGSSLEKVALHWAMSTWARKGARFGTTAGGGNTRRIGVSVMGVTNAREFEETNRAWQDVLLAIDVAERPAPAVRTAEEEAAVALDERIRKLVEESMWPALGGWRNYSWESPQADFVNTRSEFGVLPTDLDSAPGAASDDGSNLLVEAQRDLVSTESVAPVLTGAA